MATESDTSSEQSFEVEDFSPPSSPEDREEGLLGEASGPEPYLFEPLACELSEAPGVEPAGVSRHLMGPVSEWCTFGHCTSLSARENVCCRETPKVMLRCQQVGVTSCITEHPGFEAVALNPYVLQAVYGTFLQLYGEMQETTLNSCYRHLAYRNVVRWCWGYLGQHVRVVIPSCAVSRIRQEFPEDGAYKGFLPPLN
nr:P2X purinoceptor 7-like [Nothobranchius furzeri]